MTTTVFRQALLTAALLAAPAARAQSAFQDLDALQARLVAALGAEVGAPGGPATPIDRRLKLAACPSTVAIDPPMLGAVALRCADLGWRIRVPLVRGQQAMPQGSATVAAQAPQPPVVRRGDPVVLAAGNEGYSVTTDAIADQDGAPGDRIRVRTDRSKPPMIAEVVAEGRVRIPGI